MVIHGARPTQQGHPNTEIPIAPGDPEALLPEHLPLVIGLVPGHPGTKCRGIALLVALGQKPGHRLPV